MGDGSNPQFRLEEEEIGQPEVYLFRSIDVAILNSILALNVR